MVRDGEAKDIAEASKPACKAPDIMHSFFIAPFMVGGQSVPTQEETEETSEPSWFLGQRQRLGQRRSCEEDGHQESQPQSVLCVQQEQGLPLCSNLLALR